MTKNWKPYILVVFQFSTLFAVMFSGPFFTSGFVLLSIQLFGVFLGIWSVFIMKIGNFNIIPEPVKNGELRIIGPYNLIRHPMYTSLILFTLPELINYFTYFRLMVFVLLVISLILKISYEEMRLLESFDEYAKYKARTKKLIPFVF